MKGDSGPRDGYASHTVTLTADDGSGASNDSATITVTIYVTDVDEEPEIKDRADSTAKGMQTANYPEGSTRARCATFTATDPEGATPGFWLLTPDDSYCRRHGGCRGTADIANRGYFNIDQKGVLSFKISPDHERAGDNDAPTDNMYKVTVQVSDGNQIGYFKVTVNVNRRGRDGEGDLDSRAQCRMPIRQTILGCNSSSPVRNCSLA